MRFLGTGFFATMMSFARRYDVIYDERDRERTVSPSNASSGCCGGLFVFLVIGLVLAIVM